MKGIIGKCGIIIFVVINITLLLNLCISKNKNSNTQNTEIDTSIEVNKIETTNIDEGKAINPGVEFVTLNSDSVKINRIITDIPKIVFRYSELNCWSCIERILVQCERYEKYDCIKKNIIIVANYKEFRAFKVNFDIYNFSFDSYLYSNNFETLINDVNEMPYMMVIDTNFTANMFFVLSPENEMVLNDYFEKVHDKYFKSN
jgi:hypothetical protein